MILHHSVRSNISIAMLLLGACACDRPSSGGGGPELPPTPPTTPQASATTEVHGTDISGPQAALDVSTLDDAGLAAVLQSIHLRIVQEAQLAETGAKAREVKDAARETALFHADVMTTYQSLFQRLNVVPRVNTVSERIDADATNATNALHGDRGIAFDRAYLEWQSGALGESLQLFDRILSVAKSPELKTEIARNKGEVQAQLQTVSHLQQTLNPGVTNMQPKP
jgi:hypothetical protein